MRYCVTIESRTLEVELGGDGVRIDGQEVVADLVEMDGTEVRTLLMNGRSHRILATRVNPGLWSLHLSGQHLVAEVVDERVRSIREMTARQDGRKGPGALRAPMPGLVVKVEVGEGDEVARGQSLLIIEAMKMENELKADGHLRVTRVPVSPGDTVEKDQILVEFEPA
jgi:pyruvate carboxylase subunit B